MSRRVVSFHFVLRGPEGQVLDMSTGGAPVTYLEGAEQIIDGLEVALRSASPGERLQVPVAAGQAYGARDESLVQRVKRNLIPFEGDLRVGDRFQTDPEPSAPVVTITALEGDEVTLDANHPLAGLDLQFEVEVVSVRAPSEDELQTQRVDPHGGCGPGCGCGH